MSDAFDVPSEIADVTIVGPLPLPVSGSFTPVGTQDVNIVSSVPLAVTGPLTNTELRATPVPVTIPTPVPVTDNGGSLTVDGSVAVTNFPATQPVSGTVAVSNFPATQPVSGTVTANQGTSPWVISGTVTATPTGTQDVNIVGTTVTQPVSGPLTDTQLRATPVPISGTVSATVTGTVAVSNFPATQPISAVSLPLPTGAATAALQTQPGVDIGDVTVNNTAGAGAVNIQDGGNSITVDGTIAVSNFPATQPVSGTVTVVQPTGTNLHTVVDSGVITTVGAVTAITNPLPAGTNVLGHVITDTGSTIAVSNFPATQPVSGTVTVTQATGTNLHAVVDSGTLTAVTAITNALPAGTNVIGHVIADSGSTTAVTGNVTVVQPTGTNLHVVVDSAPTTAVTGPLTDTQLRATPVPVSGTVSTGGLTDTQLRATPVPVSGTVTANAGTNLNTSALLLDATFTGRINTQGQKTMAASTPVVLASDQSNISVVTPQITNGFSALMVKTAIGTTELNTIYLKNPSGSGKTLNIKKFVFTNIHTVDGSWVRLRVYSDPTSSANGTAITVGTLAVGSGATAVATPFNTPTTSANGSQLLDLAVYSGQSEVYECNNRWSVAANHTLLLTVVADSTARSSAITIVWEEV